MATSKWCNSVENETLAGGYPTDAEITSPAAVRSWSDSHQKMLVTRVARGVKITDRVYLTRLIQIEPDDHMIVWGQWNAFRICVHEGHSTQNTIKER